MLQSNAQLALVKIPFYTSIGASSICPTDIIHYPSLWIIIL
jgi:hypothetical protein